MNQYKNKMKMLGVVLLIVIALVVFFKIPINLGLDIQGGSRLVLQGKDTKEIKVDEDAMMGVVAVIRNRIDALGVAEPIIQRKGKDQVIVELPGIKDADRAIKLIGDTAILEFVEAEWAPGDASVLTKKDIELLGGKDARLETVKYYDNKTKRLVREAPIILKKTALTGNDLQWAGPGTDEYGRPVVSIEFKAEGAKKFYEVTARSVGKPIAIILDNKIISAPNVNEPISGGRAQISGSFTVSEMQDLVIKLKAGALPIPVEVIQNQTVGPTLGADAVRQSKFAGIIGFVGIALFMYIYYGFTGMVANVALLIYVLLVFAVLKLFQATLTLPGIAGLILTIGMAVDANILIFERLKEEIRSGKTVFMAIEQGFNRALSSILDSNITTIIGALVLFWLGSGSIKGFAITLIVGILCSMLTAIFVSKIFLEISSGLKFVKEVRFIRMWKKKEEVAP
ncbi:MAG: protein translocase subunit SecD [Candidatus Margulisbacteria bacterium]|nr:protein translocase subunit SecD [Candidatus Margulisiibacteriota bacterium]